jgi:hypothetical protein
VWGLWDQNIAINQIRESSYILCFAAKWLDEKDIIYSSIHEDSPEAMLTIIHELMDEADAVIHYNGTKFDIPVLNKEFIKAGFPPPAPYKQIDVMREVKRSFRFESNKMDYVSQALGGIGKAHHEGFGLWTSCMDGDVEAWGRMKAYNIQDVHALERLYLQLRPWMEKHPNHGAFSGQAVCTKCGSADYQKRGFAYTGQLKYQRYECNSCGGWFRSNKSLSERGVERMTNVVSA